MYDYLLGKRVICRSNEFHEQFKVGVVTRMYQHHSGDTIPIVKIDGTGMEIMSLSVLVEYSKELWLELSKLDPCDQYKLCKKECDKTHRVEQWLHDTRNWANR